jgi:uncharacterized protein YdhG (YjbR/CyaY superfamily)
MFGPFSSAFATLSAKLCRKPRRLSPIKIPAYRMNGDRVLFFAGWKKHYSLYPAGDRLIAAFKSELAPYKINKGTIRFPLSDPIPAKLIERIAKFRAKESSKRPSGRKQSA